MGVLYFNAPFKFQEQVLDAPVERFKSAVKFAGVAERLLEEGRIKMHPKEVRVGGLKGVLEGIRDLKDQKVSGRKLVYPLG